MTWQLTMQETIDLTVVATVLSQVPPASQENEQTDHE